MNSNLRRTLLIGLTALLAGTGLGEVRSSAATAFKDTEGHWAAGTIDWGVEAGVLTGFPDGTFQPNGVVTEAQFAAMLFRAFPNAPEPKEPNWYTSYYDQAEAWQWPIDEARAGEPILRGRVAQVVAAAFGSQLSVENAVKLLLDRGLASGRLAADGSVDFGEEATLTRAEAVQFVRNAAQSGERIGPADKPSGQTVRKSDSPVSASGVGAGDSLETLLAALGQPARKETSEYGFTWYIYNADYERFSMFGVEDGEVKAVYANGSDLVIAPSLGSPIDYVLKGNTKFMIDSKGDYDVYDAGTAYVTVFYDIHDGRAVSAAQAIDKETEQALRSFYGTPSAALAASFERISFELANSARAKRGLPVFAWDDGAGAVAEGHSKDMAQNGFFSHTNLAGEGLSERLEDGSVAFRSAGENIAYGQTSAIFAHEGWMNSSGHRKNMLGDFKLLGVGVEFAEDDVPYYTQNFLTR